MCEEGAVERLMSYNFVGVHDEVEESLSFKVRNADPLARPLYSRILYTWHITRGDYRKGQDPPGPIDCRCTVLMIAS